MRQEHGVQTRDPPVEELRHQPRAAEVAPPSRSNGPPPSTSSALRFQRRSIASPWPTSSASIEKPAAGRPAPGPQSARRERARAARRPRPAGAPARGPSAGREEQQPGPAAIAPSGGRRPQEGAAPAARSATARAAGCPAPKSAREAGPRGCRPRTEARAARAEPRSGRRESGIASGAVSHAPAATTLNLQKSIGAVAHSRGQRGREAREEPRRPRRAAARRMGLREERDAADRPRTSARPDREDLAGAPANRTSAESPIACAPVIGRSSSRVARKIATTSPARTAGGLPPADQHEAKTDASRARRARFPLDAKQLRARRRPGPPRARRAGPRRRAGGTARRGGSARPSPRRAPRSGRAAAPRGARARPARTPRPCGPPAARENSKRLGQVSSVSQRAAVTLDHPRALAPRCGSRGHGSGTSRADAGSSSSSRWPVTRTRSPRSGAGQRGRLARHEHDRLRRKRDPGAAPARGARRAASCGARGGSPLQKSVSIPSTTAACRTGAEVRANAARAASGRAAMRTRPGRKPAASQKRDERQAQRRAAPAGTRRAPPARAPRRPRARPRPAPADGPRAQEDPAHETDRRPGRRRLAPREDRPDHAARSSAISASTRWVRANRSYSRASRIRNPSARIAGRSRASVAGSQETYRKSASLRRARSRASSAPSPARGGSATTHAKRRSSSWRKRARVVGPSICQRSPSFQRSLRARARPRPPRRRPRRRRRRARPRQRAREESDAAEGIERGAGRQAARRGRGRRRRASERGSGCPGRSCRPRRRRRGRRRRGRDTARRARASSFRRRPRRGLPGRARKGPDRARAARAGSPETVARTSRRSPGRSSSVAISDTAAPVVRIDLARARQAAPASKPRSPRTPPRTTTRWVPGAK